MDLVQQTIPDSQLFEDESLEPLIDAFTDGNVITSDLLLSDPSVTAQKLNRTDTEVANFISKFQEETLSRILSTKHTALEELILKDNQGSNGDSQKMPISFTTGDEKLDDVLGGGIPVGYLIEFAGKSSSGKTNFLLQLSVAIQLPLEFGGLGMSIETATLNNPHKRRRLPNSAAETLYISTESQPPTERLEQMISHFSTWISDNGLSYSETPHLFPHLDKIHVTAKPPTSLEEQEHVLNYQVPALLERNPNIKLLIVDSITHHLRVELNWQEQPAYVRNLCTHLKNLAKRYNITVIIANQVTDKPISGIYAGDNDILWKMNSEYQLAWLEGWDDIGVLYRQLLRRDGLVDKAGEGFEKLDYLDELSSENKEEDFENYDEKAKLRKLLKDERKRLFESNYKVKVSGITTRPALGLPLLEFVDMRLVLSKSFSPVFNEKLIGEFSEELGIDSTQFAVQLDDHDQTELTQIPLPNSETSMVDNTQPSQSETHKKTILHQLSKNKYLQNHNFEFFRTFQAPFGPLITEAGGVTADFEIWTGGIRYKSI
ncbi:putative DNA-dependent ATPase [Martiniozyma asiatica (nom. inval.)]|nr:putative DNA-dependent ATPase [Martiniozyma asiatica]